MTAFEIWAKHKGVPDEERGAFSASCSAIAEAANALPGPLKHIDATVAAFGLWRPDRKLCLLTFEVWQDNGGEWRFLMLSPQEASERREKATAGKWR